MLLFHQIMHPIWQRITHLGGPLPPFPTFPPPHPRLPIKTPLANTSTPPTITCNTLMKKFMLK